MKTLSVDPSTHVKSNRLAHVNNPSTGGGVRSETCQPDSLTKMVSYSFNPISRIKIGEDTDIDFIVPCEYLKT